MRAELIEVLVLSLSKYTPLLFLLISSIILQPFPTFPYGNSSTTTLIVTRFACPSGRRHCVLTLSSLRFGWESNEAPTFLEWNNLI